MFIFAPTTTSPFGICISTDDSPFYIFVGVIPVTESTYYLFATSVLAVHKPTLVIL